MLANFLGVDDVTRAMSKGVCACECLTPSPPPSGNPVSAPGLLISVRLALFSPNSLDDLNKPFMISQSPAKIPGYNNCEIL